MTPPSHNAVPSCFPTPLRIAIADDDRWAREILCRGVEALGHQVVVLAHDGHSLIQQCLIAKPDAVLIDNVMPDIQGVEVAERIHQQLHVPVILVSSYCDGELVQCAEQKHVLMYLVKPVSQDHLEAALVRCQEVLANRPARKATPDASPTASTPAPALTDSAIPYSTRDTVPYRQISRSPR